MRALIALTALLSLAAVSTAEVLLSFEAWTTKSSSVELSASAYQPQ